MAKVTSETSPPHPTLGKVVREAIRNSVPLYFLPITFAWRISHQIYQRVMRKETVPGRADSLSAVTGVTDIDIKKKQEEGVRGSNIFEQRSSIRSEPLLPPLSSKREGTPLGSQKEVLTSALERTLADYHAEFGPESSEQILRAFTQVVNWLQQQGYGSITLNAINHRLETKITIRTTITSEKNEPEKDSER